MKPLYDEIGKSYAQGRRTEPRIAAQIEAALGEARSVLNVGAGAGSYEPRDAALTALEPSSEMIRQRGADCAPVVKGRAENLPFRNDAFSHCMTVLSMHHWEDRPKAFSEIKRVTTHRFVAVTWDPDAEPFWLTRDYFPEIYDLDQKIFPRTAEIEQIFDDVEVRPLAVPADCRDGFGGAFWRRPEAYLDPAIRAGMSMFAKLDSEAGLSRLRRDLSDGSWEERNRELLDLETFDLGYRIVCARC